VRRAGLPYGFTITVWSTAQATIASDGPPKVGFIGLFALAAVTAHWLLRATMAGDASQERGDSPVATGWLIQVAAVAVPVGTMALAAKVLPSALAWPMAGAVTVVGYLGVMGLGSALARPRVER
jgi:hypothetical protein